MPGTVILTGGNGTLGLAYTKHLIHLYPEYTLIATVRNKSTHHDSNTKKLFEIISSKPGAKVSVEGLDLGVLEDVRSFADNISKRIKDNELPPISAIVCNAFSWSLNGVKYTQDGNEASFDVSHLAHYLLVLKLLDSMDQNGSRIVMLGSTAHNPDIPNSMMKIPPGIPENIEELRKPPADKPGEEHARGFQRYGTAKLANVAFMNDLNRILPKDPNLCRITALAMDPGGIVDSRAHQEQTAPLRAFLSISTKLMPLLKHITLALRSSNESAKDLVSLSVGPEHASSRGYCIGTKSAAPASISQDQQVTSKLWNACWRWSGLTNEETPLRPVQEG